MYITRMPGEESSEDLWQWKQRKGDSPHKEYVYEEQVPEKDIFSRILRTQTRQQTPTPDTTTEDQTPTPESEDNTTNRPPCLFLSYVQGLSEKTQSTCRKIGVRTTFKSHGTLRQLLVDVKTKTLELKKKDIVHRIPCQDCEAAYIRETGRSLQKRITEHKYAVRTNDRKNGIAVHAWDNNHRPDWEAAEIVERELHHLKRRVLEAIRIRKTPQNCNLDCGLTLSKVWTQCAHWNSTFQVFTSNYQT